MSSERLALERPSPFRRRRFVAPHRRRNLLLLLLRPFVAALALVGLPLAAVLWLATSPQFALAHLRIEGARRVAPERVVSALTPLRGRNLLRLSLREVEARLADDPWIASTTIRKQLPNSLVVEIRERRPAALLRRSGDLFYVDSSGFVIGPYDLRGPVNLPVLDQATGAPLDVVGALELSAALVRVAPAWGSDLSEIEMLGARDYRIWLETLPFPVVVSAAGVEGQIRKLERILPQILQRYESVGAVDLRYSRQIVIQPAPEARSQEG